MGVLTTINQPMQFNRMQPPDESLSTPGEPAAPALFVTEMEPIGPDVMRSMAEGVAWSIPAPPDQILPNRLIAGDYLNRLDSAAADSLTQACSGLPGPSRILCKRSFDGALTLVVATAHAQGLVDALALAAPGVGAYFTLNPWEALEAATPTLAEAIEARAFWPVLKKMVRDGEDMGQPRQIRLCFIARQLSPNTKPPNWDGLEREARDIGFNARRHGAGIDLDAVTVLTAEEVHKMAIQVALWIERHNVGFDGWEAQNLVKPQAG